MKLRVSESVWSRLRAVLFSRCDVESAALLMCEPLRTSTGLVAAVRDVAVVPNAAYLVRRSDRLSIDPVAMNRLMRPARDRGWSIFTIHTHPGATEPWFSYADDAGDSRLMPSLQCQIPDVPHGSLVMVDGGRAVARTYSSAGGFEDVAVQVVGRTIQSETTADESEEWFGRQQLALGARGQAQLRRLRVAIAGLGGIGSIVALQLAHLGVGELVLIDGDLLEPSNVSRVAGSSRRATKAYKVDLAADYAENLGLVRRVERHRRFVGHEDLSLLGGCDVVVSCVDRHTPRAVMNRVAYSHLVPVIDLGTAFRVDRQGTVVGDAGRTVVVGPDRPCLACWGHLDPNALRIEALSPEEREEEVAAGYIDGANEPQPSVVAFNTMVAGAGVVELLRLVTAFAGADEPPMRLAFSFRDGTVRRNSVVRNPECTICSGLSEMRLAA